MLCKLKNVCFSSKRTQSSGTPSLFSSTNNNFKKNKTPDISSETDFICCANHSSSASSASIDSLPRKPHWTGKYDFNPKHDRESITLDEIEELRKIPSFMENPLAALTDAGASNRDIVKVLKHLSTPLAKRIPDNLEVKDERASSFNATKDETEN